MKEYAAITSMDQTYYNKCGKLMLLSYKRHCEKLFPLYVYNEDDFDIPIKGISCLGWNLSKEFQKFQKRHKNNKVRTFSKKGFSVIDAMQNLKCDRLIWFDADILFRASIPMPLLDLMSPEDTLSTHFSVWHNWPSKEDPNRLAHSCETGFFIINKNHPGFREFMDTYTDIYYHDKTKNLRRFYDGEVYGKTVEAMQVKGYRTINLNPGEHKTPIPRSVLAPYLQHYKGGAKDSMIQQNNDDEFNGPQSEDQ